MSNGGYLVVNFRYLVGMMWRVLLLLILIVKEKYVDFWFLEFKIKIGFGVRKKW